MTSGACSRATPSPGSVLINVACPSAGRASSINTAATAAVDAALLMPARPLCSSTEQGERSDDQTQRTDCQCDICQSFGVTLDSVVAMVSSRSSQGQRWRRRCQCVGVLALGGNLDPGVFAVVAALYHREV